MLADTLLRKTLFHLWPFVCDLLSPNRMFVLGSDIGVLLFLLRGRHPFWLEKMGNIVFAYWLLHSATGAVDWVWDLIVCIKDIFSKTCCPVSCLPQMLHKVASLEHISCLPLLSLSFLYLVSQGKPVEILPFLYLGSAYHASRQDYLSDLHITALLNVSRRDMQPTKGLYNYKWIPVEDSHMADISSHFQEAIEFIGKFKILDIGCCSLTENALLPMVLFSWCCSYYLLCLQLLQITF